MNDKAKTKEPKAEAKAPEPTHKTMSLICIRKGQVPARVLSKRTGQMKKGARWVFPGELFELDVPMQKGEPVIPRWARIPDEDEIKVLEAQKVLAHKIEGDKRAIN